MDDNTTRVQAEGTIRSMAAKVVNLADSRRSHPSYGATKAMIREAATQMDGAIGLYMVLTEQAWHAWSPLCAEFVDSETPLAVDAAREIIKDL